VLLGAFARIVRVVDRFTWGIVAGALLLVLLGIASVTLWQRPAPPPDLTRPEGVVRAYVEALDTGHPERAWDLLSTAARAGIDRETFIQRATTSTPSRPSEGRLTIDSVEIAGDTARVDLARTYDSGGLLGSSSYTTHSTVRLEREGGQWRISVPPDPYLINRPPPVAIQQVTVVVTAQATPRPTTGPSS